MLSSCGQAGHGQPPPTPLRATFRHKTREVKEGTETEDWIYGQPPGKITFVTFEGSKVVRVKDTYAGLGGAVADPLPPR